MARLLVISGLPGVGKTAVAVAVAQRLGATHLSIDTVEEALLAAGASPGWETGVAAYETGRERAEVRLGEGGDVVVDAVNDSEAARETWRTASRNTGASLAFVVLACSDRAEHRSRLSDRQRGFSHVGEPTWEQVLARGCARWTDVHSEVDTAGRGVDTVADLVLVAACR